MKTHEKTESINISKTTNMHLSYIPRSFFPVDVLEAKIFA